MRWTAYRDAYPKRSIVAHSCKYENKDTVPLEIKGKNQCPMTTALSCPELSRESRWQVSVESVKEMETCVDRLVGVLSRAPLVVDSERKGL